MSRRIDAPPGAPVWIEISTSDLDASHSFYTRLFGWDLEPFVPEAHGYRNFLHDGGLIAGSMLKPAQQPGPDCWLMYLASDDCAATVAAAEAAGAQILVPVEKIFDLGEMAFLMAPDESVVGVWQPALHRGFSHIDEPGAPCWFELQTHDYDGALDFYRTVFGWTTEAMNDSAEFRYSRVVDGGTQLAGVLDASDRLPAEVPSHWEIYFEVSDMDAASTKVAELGGQSIAAPHDSPFGRLGLFVDSTGAVFRLMQR